MEDIHDDGITITMPKVLYDKLMAARPEKIIEVRRERIEVKRGAAPWLGLLGCAILTSAMICFHVGWGWYFVPGVIACACFRVIEDE